MTFAQFRKLKPKYQLRLVLVFFIVFLLFIGILLGISAGINAARRHFNTTTFSDITVSSLLKKSSMDKILAAVKQDDPKSLLILDSEAVCSDQGALQSVELHMINLVSSSASENWTLVSTPKKTTLRRTEIESKNRRSLADSKLSYQEYFPALSRVTSLSLFQFLQKEVPAGSGGKYTFTDNFENNVEPQFSTYIGGGLPAVWIAPDGSINTGLPDNYIPITRCVPLFVTVEAVDAKKSKPKKTPVLLPPADAAVVLLGTGPFV